MPAHAITLHLPETLYQRLRQRAEWSHRSLEAEILDAVAAGTPIPPEILEGVKALESISAGSASPSEARQDPWVDNPALAEAVREGWINPADFVSDEPPQRLPVATLGELLQEMDEDRAGR